MCASTVPRSLQHRSTKEAETMRRLCVRCHKEKASHEQVSHRSWHGSQCSPWLAFHTMAPPLATLHVSDNLRKNNPGNNRGNTQHSASTPIIIRTQAIFNGKPPLLNDFCHWLRLLESLPTGIRRRKQVIPAYNCPKLQMQRWDTFMTNECADFCFCVSHWISFFSVHIFFFSFF